MPRIYRDAYIYHIGDGQVDVDELRTHYPTGKLMPLIKKLDPTSSPKEIA